MSQFCEYSGDHFKDCVPAVGTIESPISGESPACQDCIDFFNDNLCDECAMPPAGCECDGEEE